MNHFDGLVCQRCVAGLTFKHVIWEQDGAKMILILEGSFEMGDQLNQLQWWEKEKINGNDEGTGPLRA